MTYTPGDILGEIVARARSSRPPVSLEQIANGHLPQLEFMQRACEQDVAHAFVHRNILALCSRRAGKSNGIMGLLATDAAEHDGVQIYFGKNKPAVRLSIWMKIWIPFCKDHGFQVSHNQTSMVSTFASGGIVAFTGTDDVAHVESYLGNKLRRAVVDEAQSQAPSVLDPLIERILPPALSDTGGQLIMAGTIPEVPAGTFYKKWETGEGWLKRNWSRMENPHMGTREHQMGRLAEFLKTSGRNAEDPLVRRDWFGEFVFDVNATAYSYSQSRNGYKPEEPEWLDKFLKEYNGDPIFAHLHRTIQPIDGSCRYGIMAAKPWPGIEVFSAAIDPGAKDRFSFNVHGWGSTLQKVQHVFEFSSKRNAGLKWSHINPLRLLVQQIYGPSWWIYDAGGSKVVLDSFVGDTGLPALQPASKGAGSLHGGVARVADLQLMAILMTMMGSAMEEDFQKARWDPDARAKMQWRFSSQWHPDSSESGRYSLEPYLDIYEPPADEKTAEQMEREAHEIAIRRRNAARMGHVLDEDMDAAVAADEEAMWD